MSELLDRVDVLVDFLYDHPSLAAWAGHVIRCGPATVEDCAFFPDGLRDVQADRHRGGYVAWTPSPKRELLFEATRARLTDGERAVADLAFPLFEFFQKDFPPSGKGPWVFPPREEWAPFFARLERGRILVRHRPRWGWQSWHGFTDIGVVLFRNLNFREPDTYALSPFPPEAEWMTEPEVRAWAAKNDFVLADHPGPFLHQ